MPRHLDTEDNWDDPDDDYSSEDETPTMPCPYCQQDIAEDTPRCPHCERYLTTEEMDADQAIPDGKPWWLVAGVIVCLVLVYFWIVRF